jgi:hypothetical protein
MFHDIDVVVPLDVDGDALIALEEETPAVMVGGEIVALSAGFVVRPVRTFQVGADVFTLLEDGDGNEFVVPGRM